jgi:colanic acid/amylovoran biosynthesis protein
MRDLKLGASLSIPVAMFGQGLGPVTNAGVLQSAGELFPTLAVIGLREGRQSYGLAARWAGGVSPRIRVTGDDAIEPVYSLHRPEWGESIGVNVRVANYSGVDRYQVLHLAEVLRSAAAMTKAPLLPIVISRHPDESDAENLRALLSDGQLLSSEADYDTPEKAVSAVARCRVVVTGSYHAGVFALAQGIPVIGLVADKYYEAKFLGLSHQFGCGVEMVWLDRQDFGSQLLRLIRAMWDAAPTFREQLLSSARDQIELGERAYADFAAVVQQKAAGGLNSSNSTDRTRIGLSASRL